MRIVETRIRRVDSPLTDAYTIASADGTPHTIDAVGQVVLELIAEDGSVGVGTGSPAEFVTGESIEASVEALSGDRLEWLIGTDIRCLPAQLRRAGEKLTGRPAALAAVDLALHDLWAVYLGVPLVDALGRVHDSIPTSVTLGISDTDATLRRASSYLDQGFRCLKVKIGADLEADVERLSALRRHVGPDIAIRVDPNQGYDLPGLLAFDAATVALDIEMIEQPMPDSAEAVELQRTVSPELARRLAMDESLHDERQALELVRPSPVAGIFNIKLMKCGGIAPAQRIALVAELAGVELMWGCNDESVVSITAALHAALAAPATRYLDLDGSFDVASDVATGGFELVDGCLRPLDEPGLGVSLLA